MASSDAFDPTPVDVWSEAWLSRHLQLAGLLKEDANLLRLTRFGECDAILKHRAERFRLRGHTIGSSQHMVTVRNQLTTDVLPNQGCNLKQF